MISKTRKGEGGRGERRNRNKKYLTRNTIIDEMVAKMIKETE